MALTEEHSAGTSVDMDGQMPREGAAPSSEEGAEPPGEEKRQELSEVLHPARTFVEALN